VPELATALSNSSQDRSSASAAAAALAVLADTEEKAKQVVACRGACSALSSLLERTDGSGPEGVEVARKAAAGLAGMTLVLQMISELLLLLLIVSPPQERNE
jgi:hypothetical protein